MSTDLFDLGRTGTMREKPHAVSQAEYAERTKRLKLSRIAANEAHLTLLTGLPELHGEKEVIINFETTGLRWWDRDRAIGMSYHLPESGREGYVPLRHQSGENVSVDAWRAWMGALSDVRWNNINTKFDVHIAEAEGWANRDRCRFADVAHEAALLDDNRVRFNLDQLSKDILGWDVDEDGLGKRPSCIETEKDFQFLHPGVVAPYAVRNVMQVQQLADAFADEIHAQDLHEVQALERDFLPCVIEFERNGMWLDGPLLEKWQGEVGDRINDIKFRIWKDTGFELTSFDAPKQTAELFRRRGIVTTKLTDGGAPSFTDGVVKVAAAADPLIALFREGGQLSTLKSNYLDKYAATMRADGWIRYNLHQLRTTKDGESTGAGTVSGRCSAAGDREGGFNPQQVVSVEKQLERGWCPAYVLRRLFTFPGGRGAASDMMQVEYRLFAHYADDSQINAAYAADPLADFHAVVMQLLHKSNPNLNRKLVKNINFALIYGAAIIKFALMLGTITEEIFDALNKQLARARAAEDFQGVKDVYRDRRLKPAQDILDQYHDMFPRVKPLMDKTKWVSKNRGYVKDLVGRRARLLNRHHSALNRIVQGGAASIMKRVTTEVYRRRQELGVTLFTTVHDELMYGLASGASLPAVDKVLNTQYFDLRVPILWDSHEGTNWAECK